jgi:60 kDa SS-A/Ro ribonucleoprotein
MNKTLFKTRSGGVAPAANAVNDEGAPAYSRTPHAALAQLAVTGTLQQTFYSSAEAQYDQLIEACESSDMEFISQTAIYARKFGHMKDIPSFLVAWLFVHDEFDRFFSNTFRLVIDNGRMLRNFVQIVRSNQLNRKSFGSRGKKLIQQYLLNRDIPRLLNESVGNTPSLADIIKMVHPAPTDPQREALFARLIGRDYDSENLPEIAKQLDAWHAGELKTPPPVEFRLLTGEKLSTESWKAIAMTAPWHMTRMNLNTFMRHGVFDDPTLVKAVAERLRDPDIIHKARVFPYQLMVAYLNVDSGIPIEIQGALQDALDISLDNVPVIDGQVVVAPDVSQSMTSPVTGYNGSATTKACCYHISALVAAAILRKNPGAVILPFAEDVRPVRLNPRDSVVTIADQIGRMNGGGTACYTPVDHCLRHGINPDLFVFVSDNQSWMNPTGIGVYNWGWGERSATATFDLWTNIRAKHKSAKLVCIDIQGSKTTQLLDRADVLNIGGFSDTVFTHMADFNAGRVGPDYWTGEIQRYAAEVATER